MASAFQFGFGSPENHSDWATYAGLDRRTGEFAPSAPDTGVAPPTTFGELFEQKAIAPAQKALGNLQNTASIISNTASQISQGNAVGAYNASKGMKPATPTQAPTTVQPAQGDWFFSSHIE